LVDYWSDALSCYIINKIRGDIKNSLFEKYIGQSLEDYMIKDAGQYVADFTNDITLIEAKSLISYRELAKSILTIIFGNIAIFSINPSFNVIILIGIVLCVATPYILIRYTTKPMHSFITSFEVFVQRLKDYFNSFFAIKNFAAEKTFTQKFNEKNRQIEETKLNAEITIEFVNSLLGRLAWIIELSVLSVGVIQAVQGKIQVSVLFSAYLLCNEICMPLQTITGHINNIKSVSTILDKGNRRKQNKQRRYEPFEVQDEMTVRFEHFSLTKGDNRILKDINLKLEPKKKYLVIGSNGSGKSTLVKALKNIYQDFEGNIYINDRDIRTIPPELFNQIAIYSNETVPLFSDTVRNNITLYRDVEESHLERVVQHSRFKNPLDYEIVDKGRNISSGEKRKLELSRALLSDASCFVFDEVVSTLDIETAYEIEKLILSLNKTVVMVSNAFSGQLLSKYDEIILIKDGTILAHGTHEELLESSELYKEIYHIRCEL
jgi:ATP-binding cassette subfamily C protein